MIFLYCWLAYAYGVLCVYTLSTKGLKFGDMALVAFIGPILTPLYVVVRTMYLFVLLVLKMVRVLRRGWRE